MADLLQRGLNQRMLHKRFNTIKVKNSVRRIFGTRRETPIHELRAQAILASSQPLDGPVGDRKVEREQRASLLVKIQELLL